MKLIDLLSTCKGTYVLILNHYGDEIGRYTGTGLIRFDSREESMHDHQVLEVRMGFAPYYEGKLLVTIA
jgi:hypothetical protein